MDYARGMRELGAVTALVAMGACGGPGKGPPGGPPGEVSAIASLDGARTGTTIAVADYDGPRTITHDAAGTVAFTVTPPAVVSWIWAGGYGVSFEGVEPGDVLCFACPHDAPPPPVATMIGVTARAGAASYTFGNGEEIHFNSADPQVALHASPSIARHDVVV